jgi:putative solute:sodium symporter small subunit
MSRPDPAAEAAAREAAHRRATLRATALLLAAWFLVTFVLGWFARDLQVVVLGWPFSFWVAAQGALLVYVAITWIYARHMRRLDARFGLDDEPPETVARQAPTGRSGDSI